MEPNFSGDRVCIVGGSTGRDEAQQYKYLGSDWNIWCVARIYNFIPYATLVFDMHQNPVHWTETTRSAYQDKKLILQSPHPNFPDAYILPIKEIVEEFDSAFTSSFSWIIAYAIYKKFKTISLCGVNMSHQSELESQRPGLFYMLGYARARGINVLLSRNSHLRAEIEFPTNY